MKPVHTATPPAPSLWVMLWGVVGVTQDDASALWAKVHQSTDPHVRAWRYSIDRYMRLFASGQADDSLPWQFLSGPWSGKVVIDALERLAIDRIIDRRTANRYEDVFLRQMNEKGGWRFRRIDASENSQKADGFHIRAHD